MDRDALVGMHSHHVAVTRELQEVLQRAIDKLPDQYRAVFVLRDVDGLSNQETGEILTLSIPAVKSRLHRSRIMLRRRLHRYYEDFMGKKITISEDFSDEADQVAA
jgi:DNA-directed RNA polymerase specialized sigma24 family protein